MKRIINQTVIPIVPIIFLLLPHLVWSEQPLFFIEPGPIEKSTLYADGRTIELQTETVTWLITRSEGVSMSLDEFKQLVANNRAAFENDPNKIVVSRGRAGRGLDISYTINNPPPGATEALESLAVYLENLFADPVLVPIYIGFTPMDPGTLGWCSSVYAGAPYWSDARTGLINGMDDDDAIQNWLPTGSTIPVRYTYNDPTTTNEDRVYFTRANYNATIGTQAGNAATIMFNSIYTWDYDPSDGVTAMCFQSVAAHEIGHCLGFTSAADFRYNDIEALDIFRFQLSDGSGDFNPDNLTEFQTTARMVDLDNGATVDDVNSDMILAEYQMSDGTPYQASHFSQDNVDAIMQPATSSGETFYPYFYRLPDRVMFDAIGWDCSFFYTLTVHNIGSGTTTLDPDTCAYEPGTEVVLTAYADPGWEFTGWGGSLSGSANPETLIMDGEETVYANFASLYCSLSVSVVGSGSVIKDPDMTMYPIGTEVELTAIPDLGWAFEHWSGNLWGSHNPDTIVMNTNKSVTAHFIEDAFIAENLQAGHQNSFVIAPNPSAGLVNITYSATSSFAVQVQIYDVTGKLVRTLHKAESVNQIQWDGKDSNGNIVPSGVYLFSVNTSQRQTMRKVTILR